MKGDSIDWLSGAAAVLAVLFLLYILTAPPIMNHILRQQIAAGRLVGYPRAYHPVMRIIESDFGGPMLWYCNTVWGSGIGFLGEEDTPPLYVTATYALSGAGLLCAVAFPFIRWMRRARAA